jgi:hypothetical protein
MNETGLCACGCGGSTEMATETRPRRNWIRGKPKPFLPHHRKRRNISIDGVYKRCVECLQLRLLFEFSAQVSALDGKQPRCKVCQAAQAKRYRGSQAGRERLTRIQRASNLRNNHGLTMEAYEILLASQSGLCAICGRPETSARRGALRLLAVDHNHLTGAIRGLLCMSCNQGIGIFGDNPGRLEAAAIYLRRNQKMNPGDCGRTAPCQLCFQEGSVTIEPAPRRATPKQMLE